MLMLDNDVMKAIGLLMMNLPWFELLDEVRQRVLADMCFNMGIGNDEHGLLSFKNALWHLQKHEYELAAQHFEKSYWYIQVGSRGVKLVTMIRTGRDN
jgi:lysozyme